MLHNKVQELKLRAAPVSYSTIAVDSKGKLTADDEIEGYCCVWGVKDTYGTKWVKGSWAKSINDRGPASNAKQKIIALWCHDSKDPIGQITELREDDYGVYFKMKLDVADAPNAKRALGQVRSGTLNQFSFGFDYIWDKIEYDESDDSIVVFDAMFYEISPVVRASIKETYAVRSVEELSAFKDELDAETEEFIKGIPRARHLEFRQLLTRHISLAKVEPLQLRQTALPNVEPDEVADGLNISQILKTINQ